MDIILIPVGGGSRFIFPALPEKIQGKYGAKYQNFDIISQGTVKVPKGTDVFEFSWDGVFFGQSKKNEPIVQKNRWQNPEDCVETLYGYIKDETVLNLIVTGTWINVDVTISSFQPQPTGAYGNVEYSISLIQKKALQIYTTGEMNIDAYVKKTKPRDNSGGLTQASSYMVVDGDTLISIAQRKYGDSGKWTDIYAANTELIESTAESRGFSGSDYGHWIFPGTVLTLT